MADSIPGGRASPVGTHSERTRPMKDHEVDGPMTDAQLHGVVGGAGTAGKLSVARHTGAAHRPGLFRTTPGFLRRVPGSRVAGVTSGGGCGLFGCST